MLKCLMITEAIMPIPDNEIDYSICFGRGAKRHECERDNVSRRHSKRAQSEPIRRERLKTDDSYDAPERTIRDTKSLVMLQALKYPTFKEAYENHEDDIGTHLTPVTFANVFRDAKHALKLFTQIDIIDQAALKRFKRRNRT
ncbi:hypothetical protein B2M20_05600 [Nitrobacter vulgaris]|uniref:Uncharacterized protein n=2 Tax=Nitrobacter vulgaris TaxID=29421 RepID=A0A1V4I078_NITVU|nr:hypothetical protein B2M20_05600 [Nitrobacter vulgaris]